MSNSSPASVAAYLDALTPDRRKVVAAARALVRKHIPKGYKETVAYGMIGWVVPLSMCPETYNGQPLTYVCLASQKQYCALYLMPAYGDKVLYGELKAAFQSAGKRFDMGKSCLRFKAMDDLVPAAVGKVVSRFTPQQWRCSPRSRTGRFAAHRGLPPWWRCSPCHLRRRNRPPGRTRWPTTLQ